MKAYLAPVLAVLLALLVSPGTATGRQPGRPWSGFSWTERHGGTWQIAADRLWARQGGSLLLTGNVRVDGPSLILRADWLEINPESRRVVAAGNVRLVEGRAVLLAERLELDERLSRALVSGVRVLVKSRPLPPGWPEPLERPLLRQRGHNELTIDGRRLLYRQRRYRIESARLTNCDCGGDEAPSWELQACRAEVEPRKGAWLSWPLLRLKGVPVFGLPLLYLPLSERRSGLLFPRFNYSGRDGVVAGEDLFVTWGRSADLTLGFDWFQERGFRPALEVRARPTASSGLVARAWYLDDDKVAADDGRAALHRRGSAEVDAYWHGLQASWLASLRLYSDSDIKNDFISEMSGRAADAAVSTSAFEWRRAGWLLEADAIWRQDMRFGAVDLFQQRTRPVDQGLPVDTIQRLGAFSLHAPGWRPGGGPLELGGWLQVANLASLSSAWRDWGSDGVPDGREPAWPGANSSDRSGDDAPGPEGNGRLDDGELRRALRLLLEPRLGGRYFAGPLGLELDLRHRQLVYLPHGPEAPGVSTRGMSLGRLWLWSDFERRLADNWRHRITPRLELAGAWQGLNGGGARAYLDVQDRLLVDAQQLVLRLVNRLYRPGGAELRLELFAGCDLRQPGPGPLGVSLELDSQPAGLRSRAQLAVAEPALADLEFSAWLRLGRLLRISLDYLYLPARADEAGRPLPAADRVHQELNLPLAPRHSLLAALGETVHAWQAQLSLRLGRGWRVSGAGLVDLEVENYAWLGGTVMYNSPCRCWGFSLTVRKIRAQTWPDIFVMLDLGWLGRTTAGNNRRF